MFESRKKKQGNERTTKQQYENPIGLSNVSDGKDRRVYCVTYMDQHAERPIMMRINK